MEQMNADSVAAGVIRQVIASNLKKLPPLCFYDDPDHGVVLIKRGDRGYYRTPALTEKGRGMTGAQINEVLGITHQQCTAMRIGALFGWHTEGADPDTWLVIGKNAPGFKGKRS